MNIDNLEKEYLDIVNNILYNKEFLKLKNCEHHGINRYDHSLKVSYRAYKYAKKHNLDYKSAATGGLLHDFFNETNFSIKDKFISTFSHPLKAEANALNIFNISPKEADIIKSHMFPLNVNLPKYKESWLVSFCDKQVALTEFGYKFSYKLRYVSNLAILLLFNFIK